MSTMATSTTTDRTDTRVIFIAFTPNALVALRKSDGPTWTVGILRRTCCVQVRIAAAECIGRRSMLNSGFVCPQHVRTFQLIHINQNIHIVLLPTSLYGRWRCPMLCNYVPCYESIHSSMHSHRLHVRKSMRNMSDAHNFICSSEMIFV